MIIKTFRDAKIPRTRPSCRLQVLTGEGHLLQRTTAQNRQQKTTFTSSPIKMFLSGKMTGVVGSRQDLIFVISELFYKEGGIHFVVGGKIAGCQHVLTGLRFIVYYTRIEKVVSELQSRFEGNDQEILYALLGEIVFSCSPSHNNIQNVSNFYGVDSKMLSGEK